jgi:hypothetical protein
MIEYLPNNRSGKMFTLYDIKTIMQCQKEHLNKETGECLLKGLCIHQSILEKKKTYCLKF